MLITALPDSFSEGIKDFIGHCLKFEPTERASTIDLLEHPWIQEYAKCDQEIILWIQEKY